MRYLPASLFFSVLVFAGLTACGSSAPTRRPSIQSGAENALPASGDASDSADAGDGGSGPDDGAVAERSGGTGTATDVAAGTDAADGTFEETDGDGGETLDDVLAQCGDVDFDHPEAEVLSAAMRGLSIKKTGSQTVLGIPVNYEVHIQPGLTIKATLQHSLSTTALAVISAKPKLAQSQAEKQAAAQAGPTTTDFLAVADRGDLAERVTTWGGIVCTLQAGTKVSTAIGGMNVVTTFDPPLPASVSPKADSARYDKELTELKTFTKVVGTVVSSANPAVTAGGKYTGTITVGPIAPTFDATDAAGVKTTVVSDVAYEVKANFGSVAVTNALGLKPVMRFYIDTKAHVYKAIVADVGDQATPPAVFLNP